MNEYSLVHPFDDRGQHQLKGISDAWRLFALVG
jgi:hypothetical protein